MDIFGMVSGFVVNNIGNALIGGASGLILLQAYKIIKKMVNPAQYILELYELADKVVVNFDNKFIDKYLPEAVKKEMQEDIIHTLHKRKAEIDDLINVIKD